MTTNATTKKKNLIDDLLGEAKQKSSLSVIENLLQLRKTAHKAKVELESAKKNKEVFSDELDALKADYYTASEAYSNALNLAKNIEVAEMDKQWNALQAEKQKGSEKLEPFNWTFTDAQKSAIALFAPYHEIYAIYQTEDGTAEIEYAHAEKKMATAIFLTPDGNKHVKRQKEFGATLPESILSIEEYREKFPVKVAAEPVSDEIAQPENSDAAPLPPIEHVLYAEAVAARGDEYDPEDEDTLSPEETRANYFQEAVSTAKLIRSIEANLPNLKTKERPKAEKELKEKIEILPGYLVNTNVFFGEASAEYLRGLLKEFGFEFNDDYSLVVKTETAPEAPKTEQNITEIITEPAELKAPAVDKTPAEYREIHLQLIHKSPTNPRTDFNVAELQDLSDSIRRIGVQQPIIVRLLKEVPENLIAELERLIEKKKESTKLYLAAQVEANANPGDASSKKYARLLEKSVNDGVVLDEFVKEKLAGYGYELIAGERRWRASEMAEQDKIPASVKPVTDLQAFEIQIIENLQRKDIAPLDEARGFENLMKKANYSVYDIALSVGKDAAFIHQRLRLNKLIEKAQKALKSGKLPVGHAMEIAKYEPAVQQQIFDDYAFNHSGEAETFAEMKRDIERHILTLLKQAPFSLKAKNLRPDGLACVDCHERKGARPTLFDKPKAEEDACLNRQCFQGKIAAHIQLQRAAITEKVRAEKGDKKYEAPIISAYSYGRTKEGALGWDQFKKIENKKSACESAEEAVYIDGTRIAQKQLICRDGDCQIHNPSRSLKTPEAESENRLNRKEELFDYRAGKAVQIRVLKEAMPKFVAENIKQIAEDYWFQILLSRLWRLQAHHDSNVMGIIRDIMQEFTDEKIPSYFSSDEKDRLKFLPAFSLEQQIQLLFLFLHAHRGTMFYESYVSQKEVRELAEQFGVDYRLLDAEERFNLTQTERQYKKHAETFKKYLDDVREGKNAKIPRVWSAKYKAKD